MKKICVVLSSVGGPKCLPPMFHKNLGDDIIYLIYQILPGDAFIETLIGCLQEETPKKLHYVKTSLRPEPGTIYFLSNQYQYQLDEDSLKVLPPPAPSADKANSGINGLLKSISTQYFLPAIIVLSGLDLEEDGLEGLKYIKSIGAQILSTPKRYNPMGEVLKNRSDDPFVDDYYPPSSLLGAMRFHTPHTALRASQHWLVVDDEKEVRELIGDILEGEDITCDYAPDGLEAMRKVQKNHFDAMILDMKMPEMDGMKTLFALKTVDPNLPILIITGYDDPQTWKAEKDKSVVGILLKPFTAVDLKTYMPKLRDWKKHKSLA